MTGNTQSVRPSEVSRTDAGREDAMPSHPRIAGQRLRNGQTAATLYER